MAQKPKVAICWLGGCGGCDETIVDLNEALLKVTDAVELVLWPVALDFKYKDVEAIPDGDITLSIINGHVRNSEQVEVAGLLRRKSRLVIAFGACACFGGTSGMANFRTRDEVFEWVFRDAPTVVNPSGSYPQPTSTSNGEKLTLPEMLPRVYALNQVIDVNYYLPGCPPPPDLVINAVQDVLEGKLPPKGSTLAPHKALCDTCPRNKSKPHRLILNEIKSIHEVEASNDTCFLVQNILCMGMATRSGCGEACLNINLPCRGCFGPVEGVTDSGVKFISSLATILNDKEIEKLAEEIPDLPGLLYRFSLPTAILNQEKFNKPEVAK